MKSTSGKKWLFGSFKSSSKREGKLLDAVESYRNFNEIFQN